jgi:hypothetical protein
VLVEGGSGKLGGHARGAPKLEDVEGNRSDMSLAVAHF